MKEYKEHFRGDTLKFDLAIIYENETPYTFQKGDIIRVGIKKEDSKNINVLKRIEIGEPVEEITVVISTTEMKKAEYGKSILEIELTTADGEVYTVRREYLDILEDILK
jgi:hypothetical protein